MVINLWHTWLDMPKESTQWHLQDIQDELEELKHAKGFWQHWSEKSDVLYTYTRAKWTGVKNIKWPLGKFDYFVSMFYMFPKYTLRFLFFMHVGKQIDKTKRVKCVRNPNKTKKLHHAAIENKIDPNKFINLCKKKKKFWKV